jgi:hypothetical protein
MATFPNDSINFSMGNFIHARSSDVGLKEGRTSDEDKSKERKNQEKGS